MNFNKSLSTSKLNMIIFSLVFIISANLVVGCSGSNKTNAYKARQLSRNNISDDNTKAIDSFSFYGEDISVDKEQELLAENVVYFGYDKDDINYRYELVLLAHTKKMLENPNLRLRVDGHTDERGSSEYNVALGERRANAVIRFMKFKGVHADRLVSVSYGKEKPAVTGHNEEAWRLNRRAELTYE